MMAYQTDMWATRADTVIELERLRSREAALMAIVRVVARAKRRYSAPDDMVGLPLHMRNPSATLIVPRDLQERAAALLASADDERSGGDGG